MLAALIAFTSAKYLYFDEEISYLSYLFQNLFDSDLLFVLIVLFALDYFEKDCTKYDDKNFKITKGGVTSSSQQTTYRFDDILEINYMPYFRILTITMKEQDTYIDFYPGFYATDDFNDFKKQLQKFKPITKALYIPQGGPSAPTVYIALTVFVAFFSMLVGIGYIFKWHRWSL